MQRASMSIRRMWLAAVLVLVAPPSAAAAISVYPDMDPVIAGESFQLIFESDGGVDDDPDFTPLEKDFRILGSAESSRISIVNGDMNRTRTWTLTVIPRRSGTLTVPAISFGRDRSSQIEVTVQDAPAAPSGAGSSDIFLEVEASPLDPYVQAQVIYIVRLYRAIPIASASLSDPQVTSGDAIIERLGEDRDYQTSVGGRRYHVIERRFAIYPQVSGELAIAPLEFRARVGHRGVSPLDPFGSAPKTVVKESAAVTLEVASVPANFQGDQWLPARDLEIAESWSADPPVFRVGDPVTRTLTLTVDGLTASQLPEMGGWVPQSFRGYPDRPELSDAPSPDGVIGRRRESTALIPAQAGKQVLPEIVIPWWNTDTGRREEARLPAREIEVLPAPVSGSTPGVAIAPAAPELPEQVAPAPAPGSAAPAQAPSPPAAASAWRWISGALAAGWLLTVLLWLRERRAAGSAPAHGKDRVGALLRELKQACRANDAAAAKDLLLRWGALNWPAAPPRAIGDLRARCGPGIAAELDRLNTALYGGTSASWNGADLWAAVTREQPESGVPRGTGGDGLEPLHRIS